MINWSDYVFPDKTILVVEDTETSIRFFDAALKKSKANILWAANGKDAIEILDDEKYHIDLVLLDLNLPGLNGFDVLKHIRTMNQELPVIVQTAYLFSGEKNKSMEMGANSFLSKPVQLDDLLLNIRQLFENSAVLN